MTKKFFLTKTIFFSFGMLIILGFSFVFFKSSLNFVLAQTKTQGSIFKIAAPISYQCKVCLGDKCQPETFNEPCEDECSTNANCGASPTGTPTPTPTPTSTPTPTPTP